MNTTTPGSGSNETSERDALAAIVEETLLIKNVDGTAVLDVDRCVDGIIAAGFARPPADQRHLGGVRADFGPTYSIQLISRAVTPAPNSQSYDAELTELAKSSNLGGIYRAYQRHKEERDAAIRERDELQAAYDKIHPAWIQAGDERDAALRERDRERKRADICDEQITDLIRERDEARAEIAVRERFWQADLALAKKWLAERAAAQATAERMRAALTKAHLALTALGSRIQNDRGTWGIRKPHEDMPQVVQQVNEAMAAYHAASDSAKDQETGK